MSSFLGNAGDGTADLGGPFSADDGRLRPEWADDSWCRWIDLDSVYSLNGYKSPWWPGSQLDASGGEWLGLLPSYDQPEISMGANSRVAFSGVTRDVYGAPLGGVNVKLFKTDDVLVPGAKDTKIDESTSDANGNFTLVSYYYPDAHYVVAYKAGPPDVEGTTVNTLVGV